LSSRAARRQARGAAKFRAKADRMTHATCLLDGVCEVTLETSDRSALEAFYTSALRLKVLSREADRTWLACGSRARLGLWTPGEKEFGDEGGRHVHFALSVPPGGLDAACVRLRELGVEFHGPVEHSGGDRSLSCEDPAGNVLELWDFFQRGQGVDGVEALAASGG
jgi:catechol-2,3-dioxygenase